MSAWGVPNTEPAPEPVDLKKKFSVPGKKAPGLNMADFPSMDAAVVMKKDEVMDDYRCVPVFIHH